MEGFTIHYLNEQNIFLFLVQMFVLLATAKVLGTWFQRFGWPALAGEILTGLILGPTILGRAFPAAHLFLFPEEGQHAILQLTMLETVSWLGVLFLLLATGFEISVSSVWKQGKTSLTIGAVGVFIPIAIGCCVFWWFPSDYWGDNANRMTFTLFMATAAAISAITVIARILHDLDILKSDLGLTILSAFVVNDILGWMLFTIVLGVASQTSVSLNATLKVIFQIFMFGTVCLTVGSKVVGAITSKFNKMGLPQPATTLTFISCLGLLCGAITQWIGIHAILGFFLAGIMAGNAPEISERSKEIMSQMIRALFVPLFFATIGIKIDFVQNWNWPLVLALTVTAIGSKYLGAWVGCCLAKVPKSDSVSISIAHIPGGAMEIVIGMLALEMKLITDNVFVAIVFAAVFSSIAVGPLLAWSIKRRKALSSNKFLVPGALILDLESDSKWDAIGELSTKISEAVTSLDRGAVFSAAIEREKIMGTGIEKGIAVPHARLDDIREPMVAFGRSVAGIDWDAPDGLPVQFVFLILTPEKDSSAQVHILAAIARSMSNSELRHKIIEADDADDAHRLISGAFLSSGSHSPHADDPKQ